MERESYKYKSEPKKVKVEETKVDVDTEVEANAEAKALAFNINWNILYYPGDVEEDSVKGKANPMKDPGFTPKDIMEKYFKEDDQEAIAAAKAKSGAEIRNKNINVVIYF